MVLILLAALVNAEGSGDALETFEDIEDLDAVEDDLEEGSGEWDLLEPADDAVLADSLEPEEAQADSLQYYDDVYPDYDVFLNNYEDGEDYDYASSNDYSQKGESVLRITESEDADIEIRPRHENTNKANLALETSQIFIMAGSAFVSFAIVMLTFFLCKKTLAKKEAKKNAISIVVSPDKRAKESSIVKDYQKVPTTTKEFLQNAHIDMYGGEQSCAENPAAVPLV